MKQVIETIFLDRIKMPAPAYTDFSKIFVAREANNSQRSILIAHEHAHVWLNHNTRRPHDFGQEKFNNHFWKMALEVEIARNIYTIDDEDEIRKPMTILSGGVVCDTFPEMPSDLLLAEDIYIWFQKNPDQIEKSNAKLFCSCSEERALEKEGEEGASPDMESVKKDIGDVKETLKTLAKKTPDKFIVKKKPSLAGEIDYLLRSRKKRLKKYSRPSRREVDPFIFKGIKKIKKVPLVEIFVDRSGSMSGEKTGSSEEKLKHILKKYRASVENDVFYFSNGSLFNHDVPPNGSNPYGLVMDHLEKSRPEIAVILTDYDETDTIRLTPLSHDVTKILCVPICAERTAISDLIGAKDVF